MASKLLLLGLLINLLIVKDAQSVGVCYGRVGNNLPLVKDVVSLYQANGITKMRIYDPHHPTLDALRGTNIELMIGVPNEALQSLNDPNAATTWVRDNIQRFQNVHFRYIAVGNEVDPNNNDTRGYVRHVLGAMRNVHNAINAAGLGNQIKVSTATYTGLLNSSFPPSNGMFGVPEFIGPIIRFLAQNKLPMLANIYPYFANPSSFLPYALFNETQPVNDNGRQYFNLFDAMLDAHYAAQARLGGGDVEIIVSESGWPSSEAPLATKQNAETYIRNLISHVKGSKGTPLKPGRIETYLFAMFDEHEKPGKPTEQHFGLFSPRQEPKYGKLSFN